MSMRLVSSFGSDSVLRMGVTLAMVGAYLPPGELARHERFADAFARYEQLIRPYVESVQQLPPSVPHLLYPTTATGVAIINKLADLAASKVVKKVLTRFRPSTVQDETQLNGIELPRYGF
ncbi:hypothetical protein [Spirosoma luteum]|uniref:hypothetical protein n=1 Tax=Spirosoma luteum TaxID=431553 RepID=UPI001B7F8D22|nr:hypothetical protein [Spirosoma luteum]